MTDKKTRTVADLNQALTDSDFLVFCSFTGIKAPDITRFRKELKKNGGQLRVAKNTLLDIAMGQAGLEHYRDMIHGPMGMIFFKGEDEITLLRTLAAFARENKEKITISGGGQKGRAVTADQVAEIARMPGRDFVLSRFCGTLVSPLSGFIFTLNAVPQRFVYLLKKIAETRGEQPAG